jgi:hypothetical protein
MTQGSPNEGFHSRGKTLTSKGAWNNRLPSPTRVLGMGLFHSQEIFLLTIHFVYDFQPPNDVEKNPYSRG